MVPAFPLRILPTVQRKPCVNSISSEVVRSRPDMMNARHTPPGALGHDPASDRHRETNAATAAYSVNGAATA